MKLARFVSSSSHHPQTSITFSVVLVGQVDDHLPLAVRVGRALGPPVEDVRGAEVAATLVVVGGVGVPASAALVSTI